MTPDRQAARILMIVRDVAAKLPSAGPLALAVGCTAAVTVERFFRGPVTGQWWEVLATIAGLEVAFVVAFARPLAGLVLACAVTVLNTGAHPPDGSGRFLITATLPVVLVSYLAGRRSAAVWTPFAVFLASAGADWPLHNVQNGLGTVYLLTLIGVCPWLLGRYRRQQAQLVAAGWAKAEQLEVRQQMVTEQARARERAHIAEDMHDSLGHELSLIALRASAMEVAPDLDERNREAARQLRRSAAYATERLHEIIGLLRDENDAAPVRPTDESIAGLVERTRRSGVTVRLAEHGEHSEPLALPRLVDRAVYRVVQESLTNATKHAPGTGVEVIVAHSPTSTVVTIRNPVLSSGADPRLATGGGRGLAGLRERVRMIGGTFVAHLDGGQFEVIAALPHTADGERGDQA